MKQKMFPRALLAALAWSVLAALPARAQVPANIEAGLPKIGQIVDPACTARLYRPLMPANDYNTYWPVGASAPANLKPLYPGVTIARDQSFGPNAKDLVDIFTADKGPANRPVLIYVPGGGGNKIEQQDRAANAFYDNMGRWGTKNGMVVVTLQRHPGNDWADGGRDISVAVDWLKANVAKYDGNPDRMFIWAHSAGNGPLGLYVGHPELWKNGVDVKGAIFMSGNPVPGIVPPAARGAGPAPANPLAEGGKTCGAGAPGSAEGAISGPSAASPPAAGRGGGGGRGPVDPATAAVRSNLPGFKQARIPILLARAELDPGVNGKMIDADVALHDELCAVDGPGAKDGVGHCPTMLFLKGESHMSEVFSIDTDDKTVSGPILAWLRKIK